MIRRPPRSTLFPYTDALPILIGAVALAARGAARAGAGYVIAAAPASLADVLAIKLTEEIDRKSTRLNSSHLVISYAVFYLKKKNACVLVSLSSSDTSLSATDA